MPHPHLDPTARAAESALWLLERHAVVTRGALAVERYPGGFAAAYKVLRALEDSGGCIRAYAIEGLGAAQFTTAAVVDQLRAAELQTRPKTAQSLVLAATDPAQPYGAALPWPARRDADAGHRPGRKAGAVVVLHDGALVLYLERGGRTMLTWSADDDVLLAAASALATAVAERRVPGLTLQRSDGDDIVTSAAAQALSQAGFVLTPRGLRMRAGPHA